MIIARLCCSQSHIIRRRRWNRIKRDRALLDKFCACKLDGERETTGHTIRDTHNNNSFTTNPRKPRVSKRSLDNRHFSRQFLVEQTFRK